MRVVASKDLQELRAEKAVELSPDQLYQQADKSKMTLEEVKAAKDAQLVYLCDLKIRSGFVSAALGTDHTYPSDIEAQANLQSSIKRLENEPAKGSVVFKTEDAGFLSHTLDQLRQVFNDGFDHGEEQIMRREQLRAIVVAVQTMQEVDFVVW